MPNINTPPAIRIDSGENTSNRHYFRSHGSKPLPQIYAYRWGYGFVRESPQNAVNAKILSVSACVGKIIIAFILIEIVIDVLLAVPAGRIGLTFRFNSYNGSVIIGSVYDAAAYYTLCAASFTAILMLSGFAVKKRLAKLLPARRIGAKDSIVPISAVLALGATSQALVIAGGRYLKISAATYSCNFLPESGDIRVIAASMIYGVILLPVLSELLIHGVILNAAKSVDREFAIIISSVAAVIIEHNHRYFAYTFAAAIVIGYFTLLNGSVRIAIRMRIAYAAFSFVLELVSRFVPEPYSTLFEYSMLLAVSVLSLLVICRRLLRPRRPEAVTTRTVSLPLMLYRFFITPYFLFALLLYAMMLIL